MLLAMEPTMPLYKVAYRSIQFLKQARKSAHIKRFWLWLELPRSRLCRHTSWLTGQSHFYSKRTSPHVLRGYDYDYNCDGADDAFILCGLQVNPISRASARICKYTEVLIMIIIATEPMMLSYLVAYRSPISQASARLHSYSEVMIMIILAMEPIMPSYIVAYRSIPILRASARPHILRGSDYDYNCDGANYAFIHRGLQVDPISIASTRIHTHEKVVQMTILGMEPMMPSYIVAYRSIPFL